MKQQLFRLYVLRLISALVVAVLIYNLFQIQVIDGDHWRNVAENNRFRHLIQVAPRGKIITADGIELALNIPGYSVSLAFEASTAKRNQTLSTLARLLELSEEEVEVITAKVKNHTRRFEPMELFRGVDFETVLLLEENRHLMPGLVIQVAPRRVYPQNTLLAHSLGRTVDYTGREGLELSWNDYLTGTNGYSIVQVNVSNRPVGLPIISQTAVPGSNLILTIDAGLQQAAHDSLLRVLEKTRGLSKGKDAWAGAVIVLDPRTGQILAMVSEPGFDADKKYAAIDWDEDVPNYARNTYLNNRPIQYAGTVGSSFKMLTGLAALEEGKVSINEKVYCPGGSVRIDGQPVRCFGGASHGHVDMREAIRVSCNVYFGTMANRLGYATLREYIEKFGIGLDVPNAGFTDLREQVRSKLPASTVGGDTVQMGYGQKNEFTPLQVANYIAMIANGGIHYKPYMVDRIETAEGELVEQIYPTVLNELALNPGNLKIIQEGMLRMGQSNSWTRNLLVQVAGKTGTAETGRGGDEHAWWVGYAPYVNPEIVVVAWMEHGGQGSRSAEIGAEVINYYFSRDTEEAGDE